LAIQGYNITLAMPLLFFSLPLAATRLFLIIAIDIIEVTLLFFSLVLY